MKTGKMIKTISSYGVFRCEQWRDGTGAYRAGFNWHDEEDCEYVVEKPHFREAIQSVFSYVYKYYIKKN